MRNKTIAIFLFMIVTASTALSQTTEFSYQGSLKDGANVANGNYDFEFRLFDAAAGGSQLGILGRNGVAVSNGIFSVSLDFGSPFTGADRYLEIGVRFAGGGGLTTLSPRQKVASSPYSIKSITAETANTANTAVNATNATTANNALNLGGVAAGQYVLTGDARLSDARNPLPGSLNYVQPTDPRLTDARTPTAGSTNYIQNTGSTQSSSNFSISGNGTAGGQLSGNVVNAQTQYNIAGARAFSIGNGNTFVGSTTGFANTGANNTFVGNLAGVSNAAGNNNAFFGQSSGLNNMTGMNNTFVGTNTGLNNTMGNNNTVLGYNTDISVSGNLSFATAIGSGAFVGSSNTISLGRSSGQDAVIIPGPATANSFNALTQYNIGGNCVLSVAGSNNLFAGLGVGLLNSGAGNVLLGQSAGNTNTTGGNNTIVGFNADVALSGLDHATALGSGAVVSTSNTIQLGRADGSDNVLVPGFLTIPNLAVAGSTAICRNAFNRVGTCSSSLRYKTNLAPYRNGLAIISHLKPITFDWKDGGMHDLGFGAEDVAKIDPLLVTHNAKGEVEGVKYDRISAVLVNAVKQQQKQIAAQQKQINALKRLVCASNRKAGTCKER